MITQENFDKLRLELSVKSKNGIDFTFSAAIVWLLIAYIWTLSYRAYDKSVLTFIVGSILLPLAFLLSKIFKTTWTIKDNPLQSLGLWLNFGQLFYFPFLIFTLLKMPEYFIMVYAIITGAHLVPFSWFYKTNLSVIFAGIMSIGSLILGLKLPTEQMYIIPLFMSFSLMILTILSWLDAKKKQMK